MVMNYRNAETWAFFVRPYILFSIPVKYFNESTPTDLWSLTSDLCPLP